MNQFPKRTIKRDERGFTLIELLVVIIILGILSAIVVFAVRGADDKGSAAAVSTDRRIIRTALETYCARHGHYPAADSAATPPRDAMDTLVAENFLSARSTYHTLATGDDPAVYKQGTCGATPMHYNLEGPGSLIAKTGICTDAPVTWRSGLFCPTGIRGTNPSDVGDGSLPSPLQLPDGRVLALFYSLSTGCGPASIELYSPATGSWTPGPVGACAGPSGAQGLSGADISMVLLSDAAGQNSCFPNCGKVLIYTNDSFQFPRERWYLLDPTGPTGVITEITPASIILAKESAPFGGVNLVQVTGPNCGTNCGKVLISHAPSKFEGSFTAFRYFDPTNLVPSSAFSSVASPPNPPIGVTPSVVSLANGKILVFGVAYDVPFGRPFAMVFNPAANPAVESPFDVTIPPPSHRWLTPYVTSLRLATDELLVTGSSLRADANGNDDDGNADIFDPQNLQWRAVPKCTPAGASCFAMASVGGKVLSKSTSSDALSEEWRFREGPLYLFDPKTKGSPGMWTTLSPADGLPPTASVRSAVTLDGSNCTPYCGKALVVGQRGMPAYLFSP